MERATCWRGIIVRDGEMIHLSSRKILALILVAAINALPAGAQSPTGHAVQAHASAARERPGVGAFRARVEKILGAADVNRGYWGMLVEDADSGEVLYSLNADRYFLPASNAKLFTAALTLATLGSDYCFHTTIESPMPTRKSCSNCSATSAEGSPVFIRAAARRYISA